MAPESLIPEMPADQKRLAPDAPGAGKDVMGHEEPAARAPDPSAPLPGGRDGAATKPPPKVALYDPAVVREYGRIPMPESKDASRKPPDVTLDTAELKHLSYLYRLKDRIESIWIYPPYARERGISGELMIRFVINKDGSLKEAFLVRSSGYPFLDEAALKAVHDASPFLPLPAKWGDEELGIMGKFTYYLSGMSMR